MLFIGKVLVFTTVTYRYDTLYLCVILSLNTVDRYWIDDHNSVPFVAFIFHNGLEVLDRTHNPSPPSLYCRSSCTYVSFTLVLIVSIVKTNSSMARFDWRVQYMVKCFDMCPLSHCTSFTFLTCMIPSSEYKEASSIMNV